MAETRRKFGQDFREGAVRLVRETGKSVAHVARDLGVNSGMLGNWVSAARRRRGEGGGALGEHERAKLARLRKENAEMAMEVAGLSRGTPSARRFGSDATGPAPSSPPLAGAGAGASGAVHDHPRRDDRHGK